MTFRSYDNPLAERYEDDVEFRHLVDMFRGFFREARITPADARTAINYAAILTEMYSTNGSYMYIKETGELVRVPR